jgi:hypothetical protein
LSQDVAGTSVVNGAGVQAMQNSLIRAAVDVTPGVGEVFAVVQVSAFGISILAHGASFVEGCN